MDKELKEKLIEMIKFQCGASKKLATEFNFKLINADEKTIKLVADTIDNLERNLLSDIETL